MPPAKQVTMNKKTTRSFQLHEAFPKDNRVAAAVLALCIAREDLVFEFKGLADDRLDIEKDADPWTRRSYFIRRITVSLFNIKQLLEEKALNDLLKSGHPEAKEYWREHKRKMMDNIEKLKPIRNKMAAHLDTDRMNMIIDKYEGLRGEITITNLVDTATSYPLATHAAVYGCLDDDSDHEASFRRLMKSLQAAHVAAIEAADMVIGFYIHSYEVWERGTIVGNPT